MNLTLAMPGIKVPGRHKVPTRLKGPAGNADQCGLARYLPLTGDEINSSHYVFSVFAKQKVSAMSKIHAKHKVPSCVKGTFI